MSITQIEDPLLNSAKLGGIEALADVTDQANVLAAGAGMLGTAGEWTGAQNFNGTALSIAAGLIAWALSTNQSTKVDMTENATLSNATGLLFGLCGTIYFVQDATGSRLLTLGSAYTTSNGDGITLSTAANAVDLIAWSVNPDGTSIHLSLLTDTK